MKRHHYAGEDGEVVSLHKSSERGRDSEDWLLEEVNEASHRLDRREDAKERSSLLHGEQGCISCGPCSCPELTEDHVLPSAYVEIFRIVTRNAVNKSF